MKHNIFILLFALSAFVLVKETWAKELKEFDADKRLTENNTTVIQDKPTHLPSSSIDTLNIDANDAIPKVDGRAVNDGSTRQNRRTPAKVKSKKARTKRLRSAKAKRSRKGRSKRKRAARSKRKRAAKSKRRRSAKRKRALRQRKLKLRQRKLRKRNRKAKRRQLKRRLRQHKNRQRKLRKRSSRKRKERSRRRAVKNWLNRG